MNLYPGQGLGFTGSKLIAFGLAPIKAITVNIPIIVKPIEETVGGVSPIYKPMLQTVTVLDNQYVNVPNDDNEIVDLLSIIFGVIE